MTHDSTSASSTRRVEPIAEYGISSCSAAREHRERRRMCRTHVSRERPASVTAEGLDEAKDSKSSSLPSWMMRRSSYKDLVDGLPPRATTAGKLSMPLCSSKSVTGSLTAPTAASLAAPSASTSTSPEFSYVPTRSRRNFCCLEAASSPPAFPTPSAAVRYTARFSARSTPHPSSILVTFPLSRASPRGRPGCSRSGHVDETCATIFRRRAHFSDGSERRLYRAHSIDAPFDAS
mmetsp:Transcript_14152/g.41523  ORF Transcript_14152/g.41523 Transcript_14152/m.41523 type:complete len:234 (+) Transcript_14152:638-1339(+)